MNDEPMNIHDRPTALYRAYDTEGQLLYIGMAADWGHRWSRHRTRSSFYDQVARLDIEWHPTRAAASNAECKAIEDEHPIHNIAYTARDTRPIRYRAQRERPVLYARTFDHGEHQLNDEYAAAYKAIDDLANSDIDLDGQEALVQLVGEMARSVPYGDCCPTCEPDAIAYPIAVLVTGAGLTASYRHSCGSAWNCWWAIDAPLYQ